MPSTNTTAKRPCVESLGKGLGLRDTISANVLKIDAKWRISAVAALLAKNNVTEYQRNHTDMDENTWGYQKNAKLAILALATSGEKAAWEEAEQLQGSPNLLPLAVKLEKRLRKRLEDCENELLGKKVSPASLLPGL